MSLWSLLLVNLTQTSDGIALSMTCICLPEQLQTTLHPGHLQPAPHLQASPHLHLFWSQHASPPHLQSPATKKVQILQVNSFNQHMSCDMRFPTM